MKFGAYLEENMEPEWKQWYLRYKPLKIQLKEIVALNEELAMKSADSNFGPGIDGRVSFTPQEPNHHVAIVRADETREQRPERGATSGERGDFLRGPRRGHEEGREVRGVVADKAEAEGRGAGRRRGRSRQVSVTSCSSKPTKVAPRGSEIVGRSFRGKNHSVSHEPALRVFSAVFFQPLPVSHHPPPSLTFARIYH